MKVLIAYDGSESAGTAIDGLRRAGLPIEADALVVSVAEVWLPTGGCTGQRIAEGANGSSNFSAHLT